VPSGHVLSSPDQGKDGQTTVESAPPAASAAAAVFDARRVLQLQALAGNRAVSRAVMRRRPAPARIVARDETSESTAEESTMSETESGSGTVTGATSKTLPSSTDAKDMELLQSCQAIDDSAFEWIYNLAWPAVQRLSGSRASGHALLDRGKKTWKVPSQWGVLDVDIFFVPAAEDENGDVQQVGDEAHVKLMVSFERVSWLPAVYKATGQLIDWLDGHPIVRRTYYAKVTFTWDLTDSGEPTGVCSKATFETLVDRGGDDVRPGPSKRRRVPT
jgi:hypothetical protein